MSNVVSVATAEPHDRSRDSGPTLGHSPFWVPNPAPATGSRTQNALWAEATAPLAGTGTECCGTRPIECLVDGLARSHDEGTLPWTA